MLFRSPGGLLPLPVNGAVFPEHLRQLPGHGHQLVVFVKIPDGLWGQVLVQAHQAVQKHRVQQRRGAVRPVQVGGVVHVGEQLDYSGFV